ncbi:MAG: hypothetical protein WCG66_06950 [bacterium]
MLNDQKMDQRITVRLTDDELQAAERAAVAEGDRKISTLIRRALLVFLRDRGYTNPSLLANPGTAPFSPGYLKVETQPHQQSTPAGYGAPAPQYGQPTALS